MHALSVLVLVVFFELLTSRSVPAQTGTPLQPAPAITAITPASGTQGATVAAIITGSDLTGATAVNFSGAGVTATIGTGGGTATSLPIAIQIAESASTHTRTVTVTTAGGTSAPFTGFAVTSAPPAITGISPSAGTPGAVVPVTISGTNLNDARAVTFSGSGVTATIGTGGTATSLPITVTIAAGASTDTRIVTVTTFTGTSLPFTGFTVTAPPMPAITGISPSLGTPGTSVPATISGTNLNGAMGVTFSGSGVTATIGTGGTATSLPITITIAAGATIDTRTLTVTTGTGTSQPFVGFTVTSPAPPAITGISPSSGNPGTSVLATINGTNLNGATGATFSGSGVTATIGSGGTATSLPITVTIAAGATIDTRTLTVTTGIGTSPPFPGFTVTSPGAPTITGISPSAGTSGTSVPATISGTNLNQATLVTFSGSGVTATIGTGGTATSLPITVTIAAGATTGTRILTVTTGIGTSLPFPGFTVTPLGAPAITGIGPSSGNPGTSMPATINGTNLNGATAVTFSGSGVTATIGTGGTATSLPITVTIAAGATTDTRTMTVTTGLGTSPPFMGFTVTNTAAVPVINDLTATPPGLSQSLAPLFGGSFTLNVSGQNFDSGTQLRWGATALSTSFVSPTQLTATVPAALLTIPGPVPVTAVSSSGTSNTAVAKVIERGDLNGSRSVNIGDSLVCSLTVGGMTKPALPLTVGDLNLSGSTNIGDCQALAQFSVGATANLATPTVSTVFPDAPNRGDTLTINGAGFSPVAVNNKVLFPSAGGGTTSMTASSATTTRMTVTTPANAISGAIQVYRQDMPLVGSEFPVTINGTATPLSLIQVSPFFNVSRGSSVTLTGMGFSSELGSNTVLFSSATGTTRATVTAATAGSLTVTMPADAVCGPVRVGVGSQISEARIVTVQGTSCGVQLVAASGNLSPGGTMVLEGAGFDAVVPGNNIVRFQAAGGGTVDAMVFYAGRTQLQLHAPEPAVAGNITVSVGGTTSNPVVFVPHLPSPTAPSSVDVVVNSPDALGAYQITIGFDKNIVAVNAANVKGGTGAGFTGGPTTINVDNIAGTITINQFQTGSAPTGTFTVANIEFTPVALGTSSLTLSGITLVNTNGDDLPANRVVLSSDSITVLRVP